MCKTQHWLQINRAKMWEELNFVGAFFFFSFLMKSLKTAAAHQAAAGWVKWRLHHWSQLHFQLRFVVLKIHNGCPHWGPSPHPPWSTSGGTWSLWSRCAWLESSWHSCTDCRSNAEESWVDWGHIQNLPSWLHHIDVWLRRWQWHRSWGCSANNTDQLSPFIHFKK